MSQQRKCSQELKLAAKPSRRIVLPVERTVYQEVVQDANRFRAWVEMNRAQYPELFPEEIAEGYSLHDIRGSRKLPDVRIRRIRLKRSGTVYRVVPSFVLPYMTGYTETVEKALFLRRFGVPFWGLTAVFGRSDMYWYRIVEHLGRFDLVGTTVKSGAKLPEHLLADEKLTHLLAKECCVTMTVGGDVVLGAAVAMNIQPDGLQPAYAEFAGEARRLKADYAPKTLNLDGWQHTWAVWLRLFPALVIIRCFLHAFIRVRGRCLRHPLYPQMRRLIWNIYRAKSQSNYYYHFDKLLRFAEQHLKGEALSQIARFKYKRAQLLQGLFHPGCHRVSTMLERHMQPLARCLYMGREFHGHRVSAHLLVRSWALLHNFQPYCPRARLRSGLPFTSPFHKLNGMTYRTNWLENLLVASSIQVEYHHQFR
ncbi:MAG: hypothetical protein HC828_06245 [Blastochloris sp.]|nr:hypothetical protein [Blastochloris sp.]